MRSHLACRRRWRKSLIIRFSTYFYGRYFIQWLTNRPKATVMTGWLIEEKCRHYFWCIPLVSSILLLCICSCVHNRYLCCISLVCHRPSTSWCHKLEEEKHSGFRKAFRIFYILKLLLSPFPRRLQAIFFSLLTFLYFTFLLWLHVINQISQTLSVDALCLVSDYILQSLVWDAHCSKRGKYCTVEIPWGYTKKTNVRLHMLSLKNWLTCVLAGVSFWSLTASVWLHFSALYADMNEENSADENVSIWCRPDGIKKRPMVTESWESLCPHCWFCLFFCFCQA